MSNIDALPYFDKEVEDAGARLGSLGRLSRRSHMLKWDRTPTALKQLAQKEIENEMKGMQKISLDDPRLPEGVDVFPVRSPSPLSFSLDAR